MTKTELIILKRIEEKAYRMASNEKIIRSSEHELMCWDAHCYKYIDTSGKVNFILSQEEFDKLKWLISFKESAFEVLYNQNRNLPPDVKALLKFIFNPDLPKFDVLKALYCIAPMWDDREKKRD